MKELLYIYIHIPRTAGSTIRYHIAKNYEFDEVLWVYGEVYFFDIKKNRKTVLGTHREIESILKLMSEENKNKIKIILGCGAYFGIHEYFNKEYRYFSLFRNVADRQLSHYNHLLTNYKEGGLDGESALEIAKDNGDILSYKEWQEKNPFFNNYITELIYTRYWRKMEKNFSANKAISEVKNEISNYWFVGMLNSRNINYIFYFLGIKKFFNNQNLSKKYLLMDNKLKDEIISKNKVDIELVDFAEQLNKKYKSKNFIKFRYFSSLISVRKKLYLFIENLKNILKPSRLL